MPIDVNALGQRGENAVVVQLLRPIAGDAAVPNEPFVVELFGEKHELFDGIVYLKDHTGALTGAHFFIQIKSSAPSTISNSCAAPFRLGEVRTAIAFKAPVYLVGVEARIREACFVMGISHSRTRGV